MLVLNNIIAKLLSKLFRGRIGRFIHFMVMIYIYGNIQLGLLYLTAVLSDFFVTEKRLAELSIISQENYMLLLKEIEFQVVLGIMGIIILSFIILTIVGVIKAKHLFYRKKKHLQANNVSPLTK